MKTRKDLFVKGDTFQTKLNSSSSMNRSLVCHVNVLRFLNYTPFQDYSLELFSEQRHW